MEKNIIGDWGSGLNDADYARALAALGVLESRGTNHWLSSDPAAIVSALEQEFTLGERTPIWRSAQNVNPITTVASWRETIHTDAAALADGWRQYRHKMQKNPRAHPRLAVALDWRSRADLFNFDTLCAWLKHPDVGLNALVMAESYADHDHVAWHWPLRFGVPVGTEHAAILATLHAAQHDNNKPWVGQLSECYSVGASRDTCDVLILTQVAAQELLDQSRTRIRASFVVCLDDPSPDLSQVGDRYRALRNCLHAVGLATVGRLDPSSLELAKWFTAVLRETSHDLPIHAAVWGVGHWRLDCAPLVLGSPPALDQCRILAIAERQDRVSAALGIPRPRLADELKGRMFVSESVDGLSTAEDLRQHEKDIDRARIPRWIQANAWRADSPREVARSLAPNQWNLIGVHIGPSEVRRVDGVFPDCRVDFSRGDVSITVQLELAGASIRPLESAERRLVSIQGTSTLWPADLLRSGSSAEQLLSPLWGQLTEPPTADGSAVLVGLASCGIILPLAGDSTLALFAVHPQPRTAKLEGHLAIIHNNRVLHTARLSVETGAAPQQGAGVLVAAGATIHPRDDDLDDRRGYDVTIQVSDIGGKLHLTVHRDGTDTPVQLDQLKGAIGRIQLGLAEAANKWDYKKPILDQAVFRTSLYTLAAAGAELEQHLRKLFGDDIDRWERIHLVPYTNEFLPLEYVYDGPTPTFDAAVCRPNLLGALERGGCDRALGSLQATAPCPNSRNKGFLCPMHFWGFHRVIERNGTLRAATSAGGAVAVSSVSVPSKQAFGGVESMLFAASNRAFKYKTDPKAQANERATLVQSLSVLSSVVADVSDWDKWRHQAQKKPKMLVLVPHTDERNHTPVLEIGDGRFLGRHEILEDLSCAAGEPQLLLLLGCSAADVTENFQPYPERFRDAGVSIVLAPVAPIRGADAIPIAKRIAELLADRLAKPEPTAFGELLPLLRRELLRNGHPGVMGIVGFGDGDWLLGGQ